MAEEQTGNNQKKKRAFMIVGAVVVIGLIAGYFYSGYRKTQSRPTTHSSTGISTP